MKTKQVLKHGTEYVPTINDAVSSDFDSYETYSRKTIDTKINDISTTEKGYDWSGKKIVYEGESITANNTMAYPEYIQEKTGCVNAKIAIPGVPIMGSYPTQYYDFRQRISNIPADADAIIILGDCNAIDTADNQLYSTNIQDWGGRWNLAIDAIKKSFPTVPLFLVSEYPMDVKPTQNKNVPIQFRSMAQRYGAIFICLAEESPVSLLYAQKTWGLNPNDGVHCNHEGTIIWADVILKHLKQVPPTEWIGEDTISISSDSLTVAVDGTANIEYTITGDLSIQWTSSDYSVARVMGGKVYGMSAGTATITATTRNGNTATCEVTVTAS